MSLTSTTNKTIAGQSNVDGKLVATMSAQVSTSGATNFININISDQATYSSNKESVQQDILNFVTTVFGNEETTQA